MYTEESTFPLIRLTSRDAHVHYPSRRAEEFLSRNRYTAMYMVEVFYPRYDNRDAYCGGTFKYELTNTLEEALKTAESYPTWHEYYPEDPTPHIVYGNLGWALHKMTKGENYIANAWQTLTDTLRHIEYDDPFADE